MIDPSKLDQLRLTELASSKKKALQAASQTVDVNTIKNAIPDDLKPKGLAKLAPSLLTIGSQVPQIIQPSLQNLIQKYIPDPNTCPPPALLQQLTIERNNIVNSLNNIGKNLTRISTLLTGVSAFFNIIIPLIKNTRNIKIAANQALASLPPGTPVPAQIPYIINSLSDVSNFLRFKDIGTPKIPELKGSLNSVVLTISVIGTYILQAKALLDVIDTYVKKCDQYATLDPISKEIDDIANSQAQASQTQNQVTYNGFVIEIEEIPYTPTVIRRRAVGKNQTGIVLIQTELSFTTDDQTLINELKLIIDRDNLKAY